MAARSMVLPLALLISACTTTSAPPPTPRPLPVATERAVRRDLPMTNMIRRAHSAGTRDSTGRPGPRYWQLRVDYDIDARLDETTSIISGRETITLHNTSPDSLREIGLRLDQNVFRPTAPRSSPVGEVTEGMKLTKMIVDGLPVDLTTPAALGRYAPHMGKQTHPLAFDIVRTNARITLPAAIAPNSTVKLEIEWNFRVVNVEFGRGLRHGRMADSLYQVAQWYPRVMVYDDYRGWQNDPYLGNSEFNNNFGRFDVRYDVPAGWLVGATGVLQNPEQVLTPTARERLARVLGTDSIVRIVGADERGPGKATVAGERLVWHFVADMVSDVAWATSRAYMWDALRANIPGKGMVPIHMFFPPPQEAQYKLAAPITRHALEFYSKLWLPYAFPQLTLSYGPELGMEYPMFIMSGIGAADHETGHEWWPMMVGVNETWWGFMDEGFNQYMNMLSANDKQKFPLEKGLDSLGLRYGQMSGNEIEPPLMWNENYAGPSYGFTAYGKAPLMLSMLGGIVGDSAVMRAMSEYAKAWTFKKPTPWDFAFLMDKALGRDLGWFWYYWLFTTEAVNAKIQNVTTSGAHTLVTIRQDGEMPAPVVLEVQFAPGSAPITKMSNSVMTNDSTALVTWPVDVWFSGSRTFVADLSFGARVIRRIVLDPRARFPDRNPQDNVWTPVVTAGTAK